MKTVLSILFHLLMIQWLSVVCLSNNLDFFYFGQQWPASRCNAETGCCYQTTRKQETDFIIRGLFPGKRRGKTPTFCDPHSPLKQAEISRLTKSLQKNWPSLDCPTSDVFFHWAHTWAKYGTCSDFHDQRKYFKTALKLKNKVNLLKKLKAGGIQPNGDSYNISTVYNVIKKRVGFAPIILCNENTEGEPQLSQIFLCVDSSGSRAVSCPNLPLESCKTMIKFPSI